MGCFSARMASPSVSPDTSPRNGSASRSVGARSSPCSARTAPARPRPSGCSSASSGPTKGASRSPPTGPRSTASRPTGRAICPRTAASTRRSRSCGRWCTSAGFADWTAGKARRRACEWLERMGLLDRRDDRLDALSKGNQQRVQFIAAVLHRPALAILDEPFSGLDPLSQEFFLDLVRDLRNSGTTILLSSHQMDLVERVADRVLLLNHGREILSGSVGDLHGRPRRPSPAARDAGAGCRRRGVARRCRRRGRRRRRPGASPHAARRRSDAAVPGAAGHARAGRRDWRRRAAPARRLHSRRPRRRSAAPGRTS